MPSCNHALRSDRAIGLTARFLCTVISRYSHHTSFYQIYNCFCHSLYTDKNKFVRLKNAPSLETCRFPPLAELKRNVLNEDRVRRPSCLHSMPDRDRRRRPRFLLRHSPASTCGPPMSLRVRAPGVVAASTARSLSKRSVFRSSVETPAQPPPAAADKCSRKVAGAQPVTVIYRQGSSSHRWTSRRYGADQHMAVSSGRKLRRCQLSPLQ